MARHMMQLRSRRGMKIVDLGGRRRSISGARSIPVSAEERDFVLAGPDGGDLVFTEIPERDRRKKAKPAKDDPPKKDRPAGPPEDHAKAKAAAAEINDAASVDNDKAAAEDKAAADEKHAARREKRDKRREKVEADKAASDGDDSASEGDDSSASPSDEDPPKKSRKKKKRKGGD